MRNRILGSILVITCFIGAVVGGFFLFSSGDRNQSGVTISEASGDPGKSDPPELTQAPDPETPEPDTLVSSEPVSEGGAEIIHEEIPEKETVSFTFTASGDNLIHNCIFEQAATRGKNNGKKYDFSYCYNQVKSFFLNKDLNWINQETLVNTKYPASGYPTFSTPTQVVKDLRADGFTVFNTSSNHSYDKSASGLSSSIKFWNKMSKCGEGKDCYQSGIVKRSNPNPELIRNVNGIKVGFLSYTYGTNGLTVSQNSKYRVVYLSERNLIKKQVKALRKKVDVLMVSCHWGDEDSHTINASQKSLAKDLVKWGTDLIIGTHPHVLQNCAWIKSGGRKGFCAYSLGNFISGQVHMNQILGGTLNCTIEVNMITGKVSIKKPKLKPVVTIYGKNRSSVHVKWLSDYNSDDVYTQVDHISKAKFTSLAKSVVSSKFLDL